MNFFEHQREARRRTSLMIVLFIVAVLAEAAMVGALGVLTFHLYHLHKSVSRETITIVFLSSAGAALLVMMIAGMSKVMVIRRGGAAIAHFMYASKLSSSSGDLQEIQLLNVAEEMAIAAGMRVPDIYVLEGELGANACAAGLSMRDSVVIVTRGLIQALSRDEMQGVIGHEYSHILNGDCAINTRMIGWVSALGGIRELVKKIIQIPWGILAIPWSYIDRDNEDGPGEVVVGAVTMGVFVLACVSAYWLVSEETEHMIVQAAYGLPVLLALYVIGSAGKVLSQWIRAFAMHQREYLADASSVQFTRNPNCIIDALRKIQSMPRSTYISQGHVEEVAHMFFCPALPPSVVGRRMYPEVSARIRRIKPNYRFEKRKQVQPVSPPQGETPLVNKPEHVGASERPAQPPLKTAEPANALAGIATAFAGVGLDKRDWHLTYSAVASGGAVNLAGAVGDVNAARQLIASLPRELYGMTKVPGSACALVVALLLSSNPEVKARQLEALGKMGSFPLARNADVHELRTRELTAFYRLPLVELALPAIKAMDARTQNKFVRALEVVVHADGRLSPLEFAVTTLMRSQLLERDNIGGRTLHFMIGVRKEVTWLLSMMAHAGARSRGEQDKARMDAAFAAGVRAVQIDQAEPVARKQITLNAAEAVLSRLRQLAPAPKERLVEGIFACILADGRLAQAEVDLARMVCAVLECPLPPMYAQSGQGMLVADAVGAAGLAVAAAAT